MAGHFLKKPSREWVYASHEIRREKFEEAQFLGLLSDVECVELLKRLGLWDENRQKILDDLPKQIEKLQIDIFKAQFRSNDKAKAKKELANVRAKANELWGQRHALDSVTVAGVADMAASRFLLAGSLYRGDGVRVYPDEASYWNDDGNFLNLVQSALSGLVISTSEFREIARTDPWRSTWIAGKTEGSVFGVPPCDYTDEQNSLSKWSHLYESITSSPDCPTDDVLEDDDSLDGWLALQMQNRARKLSESNVKSDAKEVFVLADTVEDARRVYQMNDEVGQAKIKSRLNYLAEKGVVDEQDMPDSRREIAMLAAQKR